MGTVRFEISMSLDGFVAGPDPRPDAPLGDGGERLHDWGLGLASWRERHGRSGGERGVDDDVMAESFGRAGAVVMGRGMFGGGPGPWGAEPWEGWWGDDPPFGLPVFVVTHHAREPLVKGDTTFTFVTEGPSVALDRAKTAAGTRDVAVAGGAEVAQQLLKDGLIQEVELHVVPVLLGGGVRLFEHLGGPIELQKIRSVDSPVVTHLWYRVVA